MLRFTTGHLLRQDEEDKKEEAKQTLWRRAKIKTRMMMNLSGSNSKVTFRNSDNLGSHVYLPFTTHRVSSFSNQYLWEAAAFLYSKI